MSNDAFVHDGVFPETRTEGALTLRQDWLGRSFKGQPNKGISRRTAALIKKLEPALARFLDPGEQLLYIARVQRHASLLIQYTMFWHIFYASATVLVFTDRRLLHFRVRSNNRWNNGVRACAWSEVESASVKGWLNRVLKLKFKNGTSYRYWRISRADALNLKKLVPLLLKKQEGAPHQSKALVSLCPDCKQELPAAAESCSGCGLGFKIKRTMYWLSLVPSAAYLYTRNWFLAVLDLFGQTYGYLLLASATYLVLAAVLKWKGADGAVPPMDQGLGLLAAGIFVFGLDVLITIHHNNYFIEDFIPAAQKQRPDTSRGEFETGGKIG